MNQYEVMDKAFHTAGGTVSPKYSAFLFYPKRWQNFNSIPQPFQLTMERTNPILTFIKYEYSRRNIGMNR